MPQIDLSILNQRQTPAFYADVLANRPAAGFIGRIFVSTNTFEFYRDNGTGWNLIGGPGAGTVTGSGAAGQVAFWSGASLISGENNLWWDSVNNHFGINTNTPGTALDVHHDQSTVLQLNQTTATNDTRIAFQNAGSSKWRIGNFYSAGSNDYKVNDAVLNINRFTIKSSSGQTFVGDETTSSGLFVVNSSSSDAHIVALGASAPSIRVRNAGTGATLQFGLGLATTTNNFIQGSTGGEFCIFNDSLTAQPILFGIKDAGSGNTLEAARISAARNFIINSSTDAGFRFDVNGTARIQNEITVNGTGTNTIDRITIARSGVDAQINAIGGGFLRLNAPRVNVVQNLIVSNIIGSGTSLLNIRSGIDNPGITELQFASTNANTIMARFFASTGNFGINQATDAGFKLDVNGTARVQGNLQITNPNFLYLTTDNTSYIRSQGSNLLDIGVTGGTNSKIEISANKIILGTSSGLKLEYATNTGFLALNSAPVAGRQFTINDDSGSILFNLSKRSTNGSNYLQAFNNTSALVEAGIATGGAGFFGTTAILASAILQADSTTRGFLPPRMTTAQKNAIGTPATGLLVYDTTLNKLAVFTGVNWETVTSV